jgi:hypothetical protein
MISCATLVFSHFEFSSAEPVFLLPLWSVSQTPFCHGFQAARRAALRSLNDIGTKFRNACGRRGAENRPTLRSHSRDLNWLGPFDKPDDFGAFDAVR